MDTTSNALSRILHLRAQNLTAQEKLRAEVIDAQGGETDIDDLVKLPYLAAVCRETLRLYAPVPVAPRLAAKEMILPLLTPVRGRDGAMISEVVIPKGTARIMNYQGSNTAAELWGGDAHEWKPERWFSPLPKALDDARIPGVYSNLMTFSGGARSCT